MDQQELLKDTIIQSSKDAYHQNNTPKSREISDIFNTITSDFYYDWKKAPDDFIKEIAKKVLIYLIEKVLIIKKLNKI